LAIGYKSIVSALVMALVKMPEGGGGLQRVGRVGRVGGWGG